MKKGYILMFTLILLLFITGLLSGLTFLLRTSIPMGNQFYKNQQALLARYSANKIGLTHSIQLLDANHLIVTTNSQ